MSNSRNNVKRMKDNRERQQYALEIMKIRLLNYDKIEAREEKYLKLLDTIRTFDADLYNLGENWYNSGLLLDEAPDEYKDNASFIKGYKKGERLEMIKNIQISSNKTR